MTQQVPEAPRPVEPLSYAAAELNRRPAIVAFVAILSIFVATLGLIAGSLTEQVEWIQMRQAVQAPAKMQARAAYVNARMAAAMKAASNVTPYRALTPTEISYTLDLINERLSTYRSGTAPLTQAQKIALTKLLSQNPQNLIDPNIPLDLQNGGALQLLRAGVDRNNILVLQTIRNGGNSLSIVRIDPAGRQLATPSYAAMIARQRLSVGLLSPQQLLIYHQQYVAAVAAAIVTGSNLLLAAFLLAAAIFLLVSKPVGIRLHWIYVLVKLPLGILAATDILPTALGLTTTPPGYALGTFMAIVGCIYPIALICILRTKTFRRD